MRTVISKSNILNNLEIALFIVLSLISIWFTHGVLDNFFLGKTSFALNEEPVTDHPIVTLRFDSQLNPSDVDIYYATNYDDHLDEGSQYTKLELGENSVQNKTVILEILETVFSYNAYR